MTDHAEHTLPQPESFAQGFVGNGGASALLGVTLVSNADGCVRMRLGYRDDLSRSADEPTLHAGAIITAIDSAMGMSGMQFIQRATGALSGIATLDFRYDEFDPPAAQSDVLIEASCERIDRDILYITGSCMSIDARTIYGRATGRFIRTPLASMPAGAFATAALPAQNTDRDA